MVTLICKYQPQKVADTLLVYRFGCMQHKVVKKIVFNLPNCHTSRYVTNGFKHLGRCQFKTISVSN